MSRVKVRRYVACSPHLGQSAESELINVSGVHFYKEPPEVPYLEVEITVVRQEKHFSQGRVTRKIEMVKAA